MQEGELPELTENEIPKLQQDDGIVGGEVLPSDFEKAYVRTRKAFENDKIREATRQAEQLLKNIVVDIIDSNYRRLSQSESFQKKVAQVVSDDPTKDLAEVSLRDLCSLLDDTDIQLFTFANKDYEKHSILLKSFNYENLANLATYCEANSEADDARLGVQQLLCAITALLVAHLGIEISEYHLLANFTHITQEIERIRDSYTKLNPIESKMSYLRQGKREKDKRSFVWYKFRGMLINQSDGSRNIAFKVETFVNILSTIFKGIVEYLGPKEQLPVQDVSEIAKSIIMEAGYQSGSRFGWTMHEIFQQESRPLNLEEKIKKWCAFDSDVGFGMLDLAKEVEREQKETNGYKYEDLAFSIQLSDNFLVFKQEASDVNLCCFMRGYIQGVLEKITGQPLIVTHRTTQCEQFIPDQDYCIFEVKTDEEALTGILSDIERKQSSDVQRLDSEEETELMSKAGDE